MVRFLLRPGWIALTIAVVGFAFACYYLLAPWQFHRSDERDGANAAIERAVTVAPVPRASLVPPGATPTADDEWRPVTVRGTYLPGDVLVRLRSIEGEAATEVVTALRTDDGQTLLVDRGFVRLGDDGSLPPITPAPAGPVALSAYQRLDEPTPRQAPIVEAGYRQVYAVTAPAVAPVLGVPLAPGYLQLVAGQPGVLTPVGLPPPDPNPSYSYAWQWLAFGLMAIAAWVHFARLEYRRGREDDGDAGSPRTRRRVDPRDRPDGTHWDAESSEDVRSGS